MTREYLLSSQCLQHKHNTLFWKSKFAVIILQVHCLVSQYHS